MPLDRPPGDPTLLPGRRFQTARLPDSHRCFPLGHRAQVNNAFAPAASARPRAAHPPVDAVDLPPECGSMQATCPTPSTRSWTPRVGPVDRRRRPDPRLGSVPPTKSPTSARRERLGGRRRRPDLTARERRRRPNHGSRVGAVVSPVGAADLTTLLGSTRQPPVELGSAPSTRRSAPPTRPRGSSRRRRPAQLVRLAAFGPTHADRSPSQASLQNAPCSDRRHRPVHATGVDVFDPLLIPGSTH